MDKEQEMLTEKKDCIERGEKEKGEEEQKGEKDEMKWKWRLAAHKGGGREVVFGVVELWRGKLFLLMKWMKRIKRSNRK